jgi:hypothetical protein
MLRTGGARPRARRRLSAVLRKPRQRYRQWGYLRARWAPPLGTRPPIALAVCAIFRDEARYLAEWVTFHRLQGVERFYLYDNLSTDDWRQALAPELQSGLVEATGWDQVPGQGSAYEDCLRRHRKDARWIAFIDCDEFLFSPTGRRLPDVLRAFDLHPGVVVNWRMFGTNGWEQPPEGLVIENFPRRGPDDLEANQLIKSIVNPRAALGVTRWPAHYFQLRGNPVDELGRPALRHVREPATADILRINHYYARSAESFRAKSERPRADYGVVTERFPPPPDSVRDEVIMQFAPALRRALAERPGAEPAAISPARAASL